MSRVTSILVHTSFAEMKLCQLNEWLNEHYKSRLLEVGQFSGGTKGFEASVWGGAFNYLPTEAFLEKVNEIKWNDPEWLQIFIKEHGDLKFKEYELK